MRRMIATVFLIVAVVVAPATAVPAIVQMASPADFIYPVTTIDFDDAPSYTVANTRYVSRGVAFSRDDGYPVVIYDWQALGRSSTSPPNTLATISGPAPTWSMHLNATFSSSANEVGAYFGNDQAAVGGFIRMTLSVFDETHALLGSVAVQTNGNTSVDQFIGLRSDIPFSYARFEQDGIWLAVGLDDFAFSSIPEPATFLLLAVGVLALRSRRPV